MSHVPLRNFRQGFLSLDVARNLMLCMTDFNGDIVIAASPKEKKVDKRVSAKFDELLAEYFTPKSMAARG
jgi:hypothetical protein